MKNKKYKHLNQGERDRIEAMIGSGHTQKEIAKILERDEGTISRERLRNKRKTRNKTNKKAGKYEATVAQQKAYVRRRKSKYQGKKINQNNELEKYIIEGLKQHWNPDEISGRMKNENKPFYASKTSIYEWLYSSWGQKYCKYLYSERFKKKKRRKCKLKKTLIPNRIGIELRPEAINKRLEYGHFEGDTVVSGKKTKSKISLAVLHERKSKYTKLQRIASLKPKLFNEAIQTMTTHLIFKSLTLDNGIENTKYEALKTTTYFCDPYSSWQKGSIENCNKLIRKFIAKGSDIGDYSDKYVTLVESILNNKPRRSLGYHTPAEIMTKNNLLIKKKIALQG
ncbi:MAG: putative Integrase catalytic region [Parcubacteria group bacterium Gr01-1014_18]|nr:MAG: putative Integrase catalytic region [Parcubacteria group bacterium Greene0416_36]TSC81512.1 MAG: putative Integrase catalytic region [Parcubacteria group bacterium Gr01-1014_18]TSC99677.1 MAG: putative Integrase catalytic region [Parcubacteria group bacterium Greene1014_20]TSD07128.1 MAG: putative Integrase catalytic region [Parcubacteria group bacterium Greene0714_2]